MKSLKVGETVKLHHGGSLTQIKDFWSIDNIIKFRDTECKYAAFCREYAFSKWWDGFMCGFCSKVSKAVKAQMADFDFHRVKAPDNKYIPMGYKKIHKLANEEIMGSVKKKPAVKKFSLPDGANPVYVNGLVDIFCKFYKNCRKYVRQEHKNWRYFSCTKCPKASEFIRAQGLNFNIRRVAPKRAKAKILKGKCQQLNVPMGHKVIREKNYRREL